jgi:hypothetical protein
MNREHGYHSFEEFERDELRRFETPGASVDDMLDAIFGQKEGDEEARSAGSSRTRYYDEEEE